MITATDAREMSIPNYSKVFEFLDDTVHNLIFESAKEKTEIKINSEDYPIINDFSIYIKKELEVNGYEVEINETDSIEITIKW